MIRTVCLFPLCSLIAPALALALTLTALLTSCQTKKRTYHPSKQELRLNLHSEPPTLDPRKAVDTVSVNVVKLCFEGLTRMSKGTQVELALAQAVDISPDQRVYTFTLRDALWSDGHEVTAYDFEKSWKKMLDPTFPCPFGIELYRIKNGRRAKENLCALDEVGIQAIDAKTLRVELEHPVPYFLSALATHLFYPTPSHVVEQSENWIKENYVSNGPFRLTEWKHYESISVVKNENYWDKEAVKLEKIHLLMVEDLSTELAMYENHEIDWAGFPFTTISEDALPTLSREGKIERVELAGTYYYLFNTQRFPLNNVHIRRALALAINRQNIVDHVTLAGQTPAMALVPPLLWDHRESYFKDDDSEEAKRLFALGLEELKISREDLPPFTISYNTYSGHHKIAQTIQQCWKQTFGIPVKLENKEWKVFLDELNSRDFFIARMGSLASIKDPTAFLDHYRYPEDSNNFPRWTNAQFSDLLDRADLALDNEERMLLLERAQEILIEEMPLIPLYFYTGSFLKRPYVKGVQFSEIHDVDFKCAYVEIENDPVSR